MQQAQEVVDMTFPAREETTRVAEPREEPFDHWARERIAADPGVPQDESHAHR